MEYRFYVENHGGVLKVAETDALFRPVAENIIKAITPKTRAVIVNTPNNPTGAVYTLEELKALAGALEEAGKKLSKPIFLISDEPYRKIVFGGLKVPSVYDAYKYSIVVTSFSKDISIPGERLGYAAVNPLIEEVGDLCGALVLANRILGSVNAPSLMQRVVRHILPLSADLSQYEDRSRFAAEMLTNIGYELVKPDGTFYLFPKSPIPDDLEFVNILRETLILAVPGAGFGRPGYIRLSLCLNLNMIKASLSSFAKAAEKAVGR
jgi:aspartate aminotransferase